MLQKISFVIPAYNEKESVAVLHKEIVDVMSGLNYPYEIIFIDDGSTDATLGELQKLTPVKIIVFSRNFGKSQALQAGFDAAEGDLVFTLDSDLQDDPKEIPNFLKKMENENVDLVCGWKRRRLDPISKRIPSKFANFITRKFTGTKIHDMNCCFKLYKKEIIKNLRLFGDMHRYIPSIVGSQGFKIDEVSVDHRARKYGKTKYGIGRLLSSLFDFLTLVFLKKFVDRPMHFFGLLGVALLSIGVVFLGYLSWIKIFYGVVIGDRPLLFLSILIVVVGFQSFSIGLLGELVIRQSADGKRGFVIKETIES